MILSAKPSFDEMLVLVFESALGIGRHSISVGTELRMIVVLAVHGSGLTLHQMVGSRSFRDSSRDGSRDF
jgi:hypothetical protein